MHNAAVVQPVHRIIGSSSNGVGVTACSSCKPLLGPSRLPSRACLAVDVVADQEVKHEDACSPCSSSYVWTSTFKPQSLNSACLNTSNMSTKLQLQGKDSRCLLHSSFTTENSLPQRHVRPSISRSSLIKRLPDRSRLLSPRLNRRSGRTRLQTFSYAPQGYIWPGQKAKKPRKARTFPGCRWLV